MSNGIKYDDIDQLPTHLRQQAKKKLAEHNGTGTGQPSRIPGPAAKITLPLNPGAPTTHPIETMHKRAQEAARAARPGKYGNYEIVYEGIKFDSRGEARRYQELKIMEQAGEIKGLRVQPRYILQEGFTNNQGKKRRTITYIADFEYIDADNGKTIAEDFKGFKTKEFMIKKKLFEHRYPEIFLKITRRDGTTE